MRVIELGGLGIQVGSDVEQGLFVATINDRYMGAASHIRIGGPAVHQAQLSEAALKSGEQGLEQFLEPVEDESGLYLIADAVVVTFVDPLKGPSQRVTSPRLREMWPASPPAKSK